MSKIDYEFKSQVLKNCQDILAEQRAISFSIYSHESFETWGVIYKCKYDYQTALEKRSFFEQNYPKEWKEATKINRAFYERLKRLKRKITEMLESGQVLFLTLTFTDKTLENTSPATRRRYVARYLASFNAKFIANIDFGAKNGREHYHAVIGAENIDLKAYKLGAIHCQRVRKASNPTQLSKYVAKLTNHAIKETTKRSCLIYSREEKIA